MHKRAFLQCLLPILLLLPHGAATADSVPTVAILRFGAFFSFTYVENAIVDTLHAAGLLNETEFAIAQAGKDIQGEKINVYWDDANFDYAAANVIVEQALDRGADALIVLSTPTAQAAVNITSDMDDPPAVFFTSVYNPFSAGIAQSACIKPAHVTGIESLTPYKDIVPLLLLQNPDLKVVGTIYSSAETSGRIGAERIVEAAAELGLQVEVSAVVGVADLPLAAEALIEKGVEAFLIPADLVTLSGLPALMVIAVENGIPVFHSTANTINLGATVSAGSSENTLQGNMIGAMVVGYLRGELDVARAGIGLIDNLSVGVNLDMAEMQGIEISESLFDRADMMLQGGTLSGRRIVQVLESWGLDDEMIARVLDAVAKAQLGGGQLEADLPEEVADMLSAAIAAQARMEDIGAILDGLHCTDAMIAEQQAALDAAGG